MYHSISDDPETGVSPYYRVCTFPRRFAEQMKWLADWGYRGVTLSEGLAWLKREARQTTGPQTTDYGQSTATGLSSGISNPELDIKRSVASGISNQAQRGVSSQ